MPHFRNAIESILSNTDDDVFAVYNSISPADSKRFSDFVSNSGFTSRVVFRTLGNQGPSKTGSLYDAYNMAIDFAAEADFDYLNLVQADCQLMWWSDGLVARLDQIFSVADALDGPRVLCVGTDFPVFGKFVGSNIHENMVFNSDLQCFVETSAGMGDVGIFSMSVIRASGFRFVGSEAQLQESSRRDGYIVPLLDVPCIAFIPWPASLRNGKVVGTVIEPLPVGTPILRLVDGATPEATAASWGIAPIWMEDWVRPNGWDCLFPYWPTSLENPKWFKRRLMACGALGVKPWATASQVFDDVSHQALRWPSVPARRDIARALGTGYLREFITYQRRVLRSLAKRVRALRK